ncbi:hypothetical protein K1719_001391 [Acacia pycnantha]|nr:hypothetical protein K1719_001391 [Acacia pycnantha]
MRVVVNEALGKEWSITYTVMEDLEVRPMSTISTVALISKFKVKDIASLQEKVVELGMEEGIKLLKASLQCKNVLTSVFLENKESKNVFKH